MITDRIMPYSAPDGISRLTLASCTPSTRSPNNRNHQEREDLGDSVISRSDSKRCGTTIEVALERHREESVEGTDENKGNSKSFDLEQNTEPRKKFFLFGDEDDDNIMNSDEEQTTIKSYSSPHPIPMTLNINKDLKRIKAIPLSINISRSNSTNDKLSQIPVSLSKSEPDSPSGGVSKLSLNFAEILKFPKESTHAYSYAYLSPNSLAVRLSILKRSLEILLDRPELINEQSHGDATASFDLNLENFITQVRDEDSLTKGPTTESTARSISENNKKFGYSNNASSAALSALFDSQAPPTVTRLTNTSPHTDIGMTNNKLSIDGVRTLLKILGSTGKCSDSVESREVGVSPSNKKEIATNLLELSLASTNCDKRNPNQLNDELELKIKLLYALATPFYEPVIATSLLSLNQNDASTLALTSLSSLNSQIPSPAQQPSDRIFHTVSQKNTSPQAVFTCTYTDPWNLKAANDLACLIFGVSRSSLKRLTLLDLVSPDSRDFVLNKLVSNSINKTAYNNDMIFSGEIIAISKPGNKLTWASLWAKRKGNLIICMFDQVPCDSIDITVDLRDFKILSTRHVSNVSSIFSQVDRMDRITQLVKGFDQLLDSKRKENHNVPSTIWDSQTLSQQRYFTIKNRGQVDFRIPCAITSKVIDDFYGKIKLKIHSLPYIAGVFVISSSDHTILSMNESVSKNLFGLKETELTGKSISRIIPRFIEMFELIRIKFSNLTIKPGLVLPEHFFRQMNALITEGDESKFLDSIGIDGKHADGSTIKIDVQLRCSNKETLMLWVTHSRSLYGKVLVSPRNSKDHSQPVTIDESKVPNENDMIDQSPNSSSTAVFDQGMPSQLSMLKEENVTNISRTSSLKKSFNSNPGCRDAASLESSPETVAVSPTSTETAISGTSSTELKEKQERPDFDEANFKVLDLTLNETELLRIENEAIERTRSFSKKYPRTTGLKRREKSIKEFKIVQSMGQGAYGSVVLCENIEDPNYRVVIKMIIKERILVDTWVRDRKLGTIPSEIQIMATLNSNPHPNIMRLIDFFEDDQFYYIETPPHGSPTPAIDLFDFIELKKNLSEYECQSIIKQCINAMNHLHKNGVVHRDLKDENLIIDNNGVIKLIDFGSAAYVKQGPFDVFVGTIDYAAPEVLNGRPYEGKPQDVWSMGILIYTMIYKENPFYNVDEIMEGEIRFPFVLSEASANLIKRILVRDIRKRPTIDDIMTDPWLNSF